MSEGAIAFRCSCGEVHRHLPQFGAETPTPYDAIPEVERAHRTRLTNETCTIDNHLFFVRGCLEFPILELEDPFVWGVWASLDRRAFERMIQLWDSRGRESEPPYEGLLCNRVPLFEGAMLLPVSVQTRPLGERPLVRILPLEHPLAVAQSVGLSAERVQSMIEAVLHGEA